MKMTEAQMHRRPTLHQHSGPTAVIQTDRELLGRFLRLADQDAFAALVQRHGPMVLGLCRRLLNHVQDAEDAFQATFLILSRRAASIQNPDLLGSWLYGVAYRTARKARTQLARRRQQERKAASVTSTEEPPPDHGWQELQSALDDELNRLPEKYRLPLVLCYLEGLTNEEAARLLGWPAGSMSSRLARGREMLRDRMKERDRAAPAGFFALMLALQPGMQTIPTHLVEGTTLAAGKGGVASSKVAALVEAILQGAKAARQKMLKTILLLLVALGLAVATTAIIASSPPFNPRGPEHSPPSATGDPIGHCH
jgi:RNA polymerase sigma factor (sigma-70 family)